MLQALRQHRDAALEGQGEAHDAVLATLQCMQALTSGGGGMDAAIAASDFVVCLCSVLDPDDQDCSKLVVEMLTKLCLYSVDGYCAALQVCFFGQAAATNPPPLVPIPILCSLIPSVTVLQHCRDCLTSRSSLARYVMVIGHVLRTSMYPCFYAHRIVWGH